MDDNITPNTRAIYAAQKRADGSHLPLTGLGTKLAGEDLTNDILKVEKQFNYSFINTAATHVIKSGSGLLHRLIVTGGTAGTILLYDNTAGSGTLIASFGSTAALNSYEFNIRFSTGLTIVLSAATNVTVAWR